MRAFESELVKLRRPLVLVGTVGTMVAIAVLATVLAFAVGGGSETTFNASRPGAVDLSSAALSGSTGATRGFVVASGFGGVVLLVAFAVSVASEYSTGTLRTLLLTEPRRIRVLAGKLAGLLTLVFFGFLIAEAASVVTAVICAPIKGVSTEQWFGLHGVRELGVAYLNAALAGAGWGLFGAAVAVLLRSVIATLGVVLVWFFPLENVLHNSWSAADRWLPGLLLQGLHAGAGAPVSEQRALLTVFAYLALALSASGLAFVRRDVTA